MSVSGRIVNVALALCLCIAVSSAITAAVRREGAAAAPLAAKEDRPRHEVIIHRPDGPPRARVGVDANGAPIEVACGTCHATRTANVSNARGADLDEFHQGLEVAHGGSTCIACHDPRDYDRLRLADGRPVEFVDVMDLCSQCHGPERRDYDHGAHGGMTGYWDLSRGPRARNHCVDCHDPHAPAFPAMRPTFKPIDRFLSSHARQESNE